MVRCNNNGQEISLTPARHCFCYFSFSPSLKAFPTASPTTRYTLKDGSKMIGSVIMHPENVNQWVFQNVKPELLFLLFFYHIGLSSYEVVFNTGVKVEVEA